MELLPNTFTSYKLTPEEEVAGFKFTEINRAVLQNLRSQISQELVGMLYDPTNPLDYASQKIYKDGQLAMLNYLLDMSSSNPLLNQE